MAQTQQPGDGEAEHAQGAGGHGLGDRGFSDDSTRETPQVPGADPSRAEDRTALLPPTDAAQTPSRGTAAPLGTVGDGRYRLTHRLGRGGMAEVYAAQDVRLGRTVAVKLLRAELAQDDVARLRFTREAHAVAALNHHSIVSVYDTGAEQVGGDSTPYIVMELIEGRTVRELLADEDAPPVDQALIIIAGVLEALAYSHRNSIVHRDIKPANVIITHSGAVKVMDFGIARALTGAATTMTQTGMVMGTPQYLSPEQALGKPVDHRSDLYAAGCMLYELLTLRPPFTGDTPLSVVYQHVQDMPVAPSEANPRVPAQLDDLVLRSLAKDPDDRFQSADEFRAHVQHALREMHGAAGIGYAGGAATVGRTGSGGSGGYPGYESGASAVTKPLGSVDGPGTASDQTAMLPYPASAQYDTPLSPYSATGGNRPGGPYDGGHGGHGGDGYGDGDGGRGRRRSRWPLVGGLVLVLAAAAVGISMALSPADHKTQPPHTPNQPVQNPVTTPIVPSADTPSPSLSRSTGGNTNPGRYTPPPDTTNDTAQSPSSGRSSGASPSPSASASASPSSSASDSPSDTSAPPTKPTDGSSPSTGVSSSPGGGKSTTGTDTTP
ncbi:protein kinase [Kitasatospora sp. GP82]|uniref:protein kinase domain-containing protein n=1 Tax=Kitasatospora sp. GP82 TaxID=3035089 RepID=UPI0024731233|nr:protein kinase [Kitasatospora sp. GP82]MDH6123719.1 tRNA A-37 threonylcarbamoyl transferase component Bud32 [Kitasatospora sp. GP82]